MIGGILSAIIVLFIDWKADEHFIAVGPLFDDVKTPKSFSACISELVGTFFFIFLFIISTDVKT